MSELKFKIGDINFALNRKSDNTAWFKVNDKEVEVDWNEMMSLCEFVGDVAESIKDINFTQEKRNKVNSKIISENFLISMIEEEINKRRNV